MWTTDVEVEEPVWDECYVAPGDPTRAYITLRLSEAPHDPWQEELERLIRLREEPLGVEDVDFDGKLLRFSVDVGNVEEVVDYIDSGCANANDRYRERFRQELEAHIETKDQLYNYFEE